VCEWVGDGGSERDLGVQFLGKCLVWVRLDRQRFVDRQHLEEEREFPVELVCDRLSKSPSVLVHPVGEWHSAPWSFVGRCGGRWVVAAAVGY
jgi:hypothetical protein